MGGKFVAIMACILLLGMGTSYSSPDPLTTFQPPATTATLNNPYMGWAPPANGGPYNQRHRLVYANFLWKELEPEEGRYDFEKLEKKYKFKEWAEQGMKVIVRVVMDVPKEESNADIPRWLYYKINKDGKWYHNDYGKGFSPNYANPILMDAHKKLIDQLGDRYNSDIRIAFIQIGSIGHWGEWHTNVDILFPNRAITDQYVNHYLNAFPDKHLLMRRPHQIALDNHLGLFNDMFAEKNHTENYINWFTNGYTLWLNKESHPAMPRFWEFAPSGGEFDGNVHSGLPYLMEPYFTQTLAMARDTHISWLGPNSPANYPLEGELQGNLDQFMKTIGYRFRILSETHPSSIKRGSLLQVEINWENSGVAPFYYPWKLQLSLEDKKGNIVLRSETNEDIRKWLPGRGTFKHMIKIPTSLTKSEYTLCISIIDPSLGKPEIEFAMGGDRGDKIYRLGKITVK